MEAAAGQKKVSLRIVAGELLDLFSLSEKLKYAIKASLALVLAYLIPFSQGWEDAYTAAITVMLISVMGPLDASVIKGMMRVAGTVLGAIIGMTLIALFPQDRILYLILLSILVTVILYFGRAYKGDTTIFMLTALTMMLVFKEGEVDEVFMYGINRTFMTVLGIVIYTFIGVLLWPARLENERTGIAEALSRAAGRFYGLKAQKKEKRELIEAIIDLEQELQRSANGINETNSQMGVTPQQWQSILSDYAKIDELLYLLNEQEWVDRPQKLKKHLENFDRGDKEIKVLFEELVTLWQHQEPINIPDAWKPEYRPNTLIETGHLERASIIEDIRTTEMLHARLRILAEKLNSMISPQPTSFQIDKMPGRSNFIWLDVEDIKGTIITFLIFWAGIVFWVYFNSPEGFSIAAVATALSMTTTYSSAKPSLLIILFTFSFLFAGIMYIFVLPHLHNGLELGLFLFAYSFIGFYLLKPPLSMFFLLGIATLYITNDMIFSFNLFLMILLVFYLFLFLLLLFDYIPFSMKPEKLLLILKHRFFFLAYLLQRSGVNILLKKHSVLQVLLSRYCSTHLLQTVEKMGFWAKRIDGRFFDKVDKKQLDLFVQACENLSYHLLILHRELLNRRKNRLIVSFIGSFYKKSLYEAMKPHSMQDRSTQKHLLHKKHNEVAKEIEATIDSSLHELDFETYDKNTIAEFYEMVSLNKNAWLKFMRCQHLMETIDFNQLKMSRF